MSQSELQNYLESLRYACLRFVSPPLPKPEQPQLTFQLPPLRVPTLPNSYHHPFTCYSSESEPKAIHRQAEELEGQKAQHKYRCQFCPMSFRWKPNLNRHARVHSGARPYACKQCGRSFASSSNLKQHRLVHDSTPVMQYVCQVSDCGKAYKHSGSLFNHTKRMHNRSQ